MKFLICSTVQKNGGPIALHKLCDLLNQKGHNAKIFYLETMRFDSGRSKHFIPNAIDFLFKLAKFESKKVLSIFLKENNSFSKNKLKGFYYVPIRNMKRKILPFVDSKTIVIYPDICYGNPLRAKKVVRYLLFHNRYPNDKYAYGKEDLFYAYREFFNDYSLNSKCNILKINSFDWLMYRKTNFSTREGQCYIIRKGKKRTDLPQTFDGPVLDNLTEKEIVSAFNKYKFCYFYDTQTFYANIAAVCGCIPVVILEEGKSKNDYKGVGDIDYGVAYGNTKEEIERAIATRDNLIDYLKKKEESNLIAVDKFIMRCEDYFG